MKSKKIIAGIISLVLITFQNVFAIEANNNFELKTITNNWKELVIELNVINPSNQQIASVQSWLTFDKTKLQWVEINTEWSPFDFVIPWESDFEWNLVKIWRSTLWSNTAKEKVFVAKIKFNILEKSETEIKFYDYKTDDSWHVSIQVFDNGFPINTLSWEPISLKIDLSSSLNLWDTNNWNIYSNFNNNEQSQLDNTITRPSNVQLTSENSSVTLKWNKVVWSENYYLYYWKTSWRYLNRRLVWNVDSYKIEWLEIWKQYFFAISAVSELNKESDYSDEVAIIVWNELSSTSILIPNKINNNLDTNNTWKWIDTETIKNNESESINIVKAKENTKTWPNEILVISFIFSLIFTWFFMRKKIIKLVNNNQ